LCIRIDESEVEIVQIPIENSKEDENYRYPRTGLIFFFCKIIFSKKKNK